MVYKFLFILGFLAVQCNDAAPKAVQTSPETAENNRDIQRKRINPLPYNLEIPNQSFPLDAALNEISGLTTSPNADLLAAVNDEKGQIYFINKKTGKSTPSIVFENEGDFEGLEFVADTLWVVKSKGKLFKLWHLDKTPFDMMPVKIENLSKADNIEGLGYDAQNKRLLLAQKGDKNSIEQKRTIFAFDLTTQTPSVKKVFDINLADFQAFLRGKTGEKYEKLIQDYITTPLQTGFDFGPSGIAVHPISGNIYVISSINKILMVLTPEGKIVDIAKLNKAIFKQPEGICFDANGTMYISSEIKDAATSMLFVFNMIK